MCVHVPEKRKKRILTFQFIARPIRNFFWVYQYLYKQFFCFQLLFYEYYWMRFFSICVLSQLKLQKDWHEYNLLLHLNEFQRKECFFGIVVVSFGRWISLTTGENWIFHQIQCREIICLWNMYENSKSEIWQIIFQTGNARK